MMDINDKFWKIMDSGLAFQIFNKPVKDDQIWDIKVYWRFMDYDGKTILKESEGFSDLENCLDDALEFIRIFDREIIYEKGE